jgi:hypothetical protein
MKKYNFKKYGTFDITNIKNKLKGLDWYKFTFRQDVFVEQNRTLTIPLIFDITFQKIIKYENFNIFKEDLITITDYFCKVVGEGSMYSAMFINLPKQQSIDRHIDGKYAAQNFLRIHIPIQTNIECFFEVDNEVINMKEGEIWEIDNNNKYHSVKNDGNDDRIHLLIDWKLK